MKRGVVFLIFSFLVVMVDRWGYFNWLKSPIIALIRPIQFAIRGADVETGANEDKVFSLIDKAEMIKLRRENESLRELLGTKISPAWKFIPARIIKNEDGFLTVDAGSSLGIKTEMVVIALARDEVNNGVLVGGVEKVSLMQSRVRLIRDEFGSLDVKTEGGSVGVVGAGDEGLVLSQVLQSQGLNEGELILSKGGDGWPGDLVVGRVGSVSRVDTKIYLEADVEELINFSDLSQVFVVSF